MAALLRREGLYWSNLQDWRRQREEWNFAGTDPSQARAQIEADPLDHQLRQVQAENRKLKRKLENIMLDIQKKVSHLLGISLESSSERRRELMDKALRFSETHGFVWARRRWVCHRQASIGKNDGGNSRRLKLDLGRHLLEPWSPPEREAVVEVLHSRIVYRQSSCRRMGGAWMKGGTCARSEPCTAFWPNVWKLRRRQRRHPHYSKPNFWPPAQTLVMGHHPEGARKWSYLRDPGHLQPLCGGLDGGHPGKLTPGQGLDRPELLQAGDRSG